MTLAEITLTAEQFLEPKGGSPEVNALLARCITEGLVLDVALRSAGAYLAGVAVAGDTEACCLEGRWRSPHIAHAPASIGALLLAPLLFRITRAQFAPAALATLGKDTRTVADLVMRLYYIAALRRQGFRFVDTGVPWNEAIGKLSLELARTYLWIAKANVRDEFLRTDNAMERVLVDAHLPVVSFTHPVLRAGAQHIRAQINDGDRNVAAQKRRLLQLRDRWIAQSQS